MPGMGELEQAVMEILWDHPGALSVREVHDRVSRDRELAYTTVMTVLDRLAKKGLVSRQLEARAWLYRPARSRVQQVSADIADLLRQLPAGEQRSVLAALANAVRA